VQPDVTEGTAQSTGRLLFKGPNNQPEVGMWPCTPGRWRLFVPLYDMCHFAAGRAVSRCDGDEAF
jgi:uncharacterized cupin superfamily protein